MNHLRDYEVSIWTLQDSFIAVLKAFNLENKNQIQDPQLHMRDDGTREFSFSIPMYIYDGPNRIENPNWYNTRNGNILADMRKIKVIFNKGDKELEEVFEFLIIKVTERQDSDGLICDVECEGLAFHELGKIGYKISLNQDDFLAEWSDWAEESYDEDDPAAVAEHQAREPKNNIDYWCNKIFKNSKWRYSIEMDWAAYDGMVVVKYEREGYALIDWAIVDVSRIYNGEIFYASIIPYSEMSPEMRAEVNAERERLGLRRYDKIYEDAYVSSWASNGSILTPTHTEDSQEKYRLIDEEESNIYNLTQTIAEAFGVFCKYKYYYDENYHIIDREVIFYNNFLQEATGEIALTYPYNASSISREMDGTDIVTKMFVKNIEDNATSSGYASIMDTKANKSREDYVLNFDYLHEIGTISEEQYQDIEKFELAIHDLNMAMFPLESRLIALQNEYTEVSAAEALAKNAVSLDLERISATDDLLNALTDGTGRLAVTKERPEICYIIENTARAGTYCINIRQKGILANTIHVYRNYNVTSLQLTDEVTGYITEIDEFGNLTGKLSNINRGTTTTSMVYVIYEYEPQLYYENIKRVWQQRKNNDDAEYQKQHARVVELDGEKNEDGNRVSDGLIQVTDKQLTKLRDDKALLIAKFEQMMGPALREGFWQPEDDYANYGNKYVDRLLLTNSSFFKDNLSSIGWDNVTFPDENLNYYELGVTQTKTYYPCINLTNYINRFTDAEIEMRADVPNLTLESLSFIFQDMEYESIEDPAYFRYFPVGSQCQFAFIRRKGDALATPVLMITGVESLRADIHFPSGGAAHERIGYLKTTVSETGEITNEVKDIVGEKELQWITDLSNYEIVYPRIRVNSTALKVSEDELSILRNNSLLHNYNDYTVLMRDDTGDDEAFVRYYITIRPETIFRSGALNGSYRFNYAISNTGLIMYLDAIQVLKENAYPKVSYEIDPSLANESFVRLAYRGLNKLVHINDDELKFENVRGYISELELDLDHPWEDKITITNYKTKFEDLFSSIVAQTEEMKKNAYIVGRAESLFTDAGDFKSDIIQGVMDRVDLNYSFNNGTLTIDEKNGIWGTSDDGVVAFRGGGIFTATKKDEYGDWIWNTGILPSGINADLITTGQLDTNLIRIYAGDNLKFQLNGDGLYAYKSWLEDSPTAGSPADTYKAQQYRISELMPGQYVVHNSEGLFLVAKAGSYVLEDDNRNYREVLQDINRVSISWDGLTIKNWDNQTVFFADGNGNLNITGTIYATAGEFSGTLKAAELKIQTGDDKQEDFNEFFNNRYTDDDTFNTFLTKDFQDALNEMEKLDDIKSQTWYQPTDPSKEWPADEYNKHVGDIWYCNTEDISDPNYQRSFIWRGSYWEEMKATVPQDLYDTFDGKVDMYVDEYPTIPYHEGDLWICSDENDPNYQELLVCIKGRNEGSFTRSDWAKKDKYTDDKKIDDFLKEDGQWQKYQAQVKEQMDGKAETWRQDNPPSDNWTSNEDKKEHIGDMWYCTKPGDTTHYQKFWYWNGTTWELTQTDPPKAVFDVLDGKSQIFYETPTVPYYERDMWVCNIEGDANYQELLFCIVKERTDKFTRSDWAKKDKYTDDTATNKLGETVTAQGTQIETNRQQIELRAYKTTVDSLIQESYYEYVLSDSNTIAPDNNADWKRTAPPYEDGKYLWSRNVVIKSNGDKTTATPVCMAGAQGVGIDYTTVEYVITDTNNQPAENAGWSSSYDSSKLTEGKYLWSRTRDTYTDPGHTHTEWRYSVSYIGTNGAAGRGITSSDVKYAYNTSPTNPPPDSAFDDTIPNVPAGQYLWTKTIITYTDSKDPSIIYSVSRIGVDGAAGTAGRGISSIDNYYLTSSKNSGVTTASSEGWVKNPATIPATDATKKYLWNYEVINYTSGNPSSTNPHIIGTYAQDGKGISKIEEFYALSTSTTTPADSEFKPEVKTPTPSQRYLWNYERITYTTGTDPYISDKHIIAVYGETGQKGDPGTSSYTHIKYSVNSNGNPPLNAPTTATKYIGVYTGTSQTAPSSYTSYTWSKYVGDPGAAGNGIQSITYYYHATSSQTPVPDPSLFTSLTIPTMSETNKYLWQKEVIDFTDTSVNDKTTVLLIAVYGDKGKDGTNGTNGTNGKDGTSVTIISTVIEYTTSASGTTTPTSGWGKTVPSVAQGQYLWTRTTVNYSDGNKTETYSSAYNGKNGATGARPTRFVEQWCVLTSPDARPDGNTPILTEMPTPAPDTYIWSRQQIYYDDPSLGPSYTDWILNAIVTEYNSLFDTTNEYIQGTVSEQQRLRNEYDEYVSSANERFTQMTQTSESLKAEIKNFNNISTYFTASEKGLSIAKSNSKWYTFTSNEGYAVKYTDNVDVKDESGQSYFEVSKDKCTVTQLQVGFGDNRIIMMPTIGGIQWV